MLLRAARTVVDVTWWGKVSTVLDRGIGGSIHSLTNSESFAIGFKGVIKTWTYFYKNDRVSSSLRIGVLLKNLYARQRSQHGRS